MIRPRRLHQVPRVNTQALRWMAIMRQARLPRPSCIAYSRHTSKLRHGANLGILISVMGPAPGGQDWAGAESGETSGPAGSGGTGSDWSGPVTLSLPRGVLDVADEVAERVSCSGDLARRKWALRSLGERNGSGFRGEAGSVGWAVDDSRSPSEISKGCLDPAGFSSGG